MFGFERKWSIFLWKNTNVSFDTLRVKTRFRGQSPIAFPILVLEQLQKSIAYIFGDCFEIQQLALYVYKDIKKYSFVKNWSGSIPHINLLIVIDYARLNNSFEFWKLLYTVFKICRKSNFFNSLSNTLLLVNWNKRDMEHMHFVF